MLPMRTTRRLLLFAIVCIAFSNHISAQGFLHRDGKIIVDGKGKKFILRGMGIGGWMLQEGYMFRLSNLGQQYRIREKIQELVGPEKTKQFYDQWLLNHTTQADIDSMASWGFNSIRLPMHYNLYTLPVEQEPVPGKNTWIEKGFAMTDSLLRWCARNKMYLILDLHATPGGQGNDLPISDRDPAKPSLWQSEANQQKMIALWKQLAQRYAKEPWIGGYDIINEPNWGFEDEKDTRGTSEKTNAPLQKLMIDITKAIREVDKNHIVIIEGNGFGNNYNGIIPDWDNNLVMSFHKYGNFNNTGSIGKFLEWRDKFNTPLWLGESGENSNTWFTEAIGLAEKNDIGWAWWQSKKMGINQPLEIRQPEGYQSFLDYATGKGPKPAEQDAWKIFTQLLENIKIQNNIYHRDVTDAMFRQVHSATAIPFANATIDRSRNGVPAVQFDLGSQRVAYYDRDSSRYQYTPGVNTVGNKGNAFRNDGVDIRNGAVGPYVFSIEDGEWLQYTVNIGEDGNYTLMFDVSAEKEGGQISFFDNERILVNAKPVPATGGEQTWKRIEAGDSFPLKKGIHRFRVQFDKGGFNFISFALWQKN